jgi:adenine deaminase
LCSSPSAVNCARYADSARVDETRLDWSGHDCRPGNRRDRPNHKAAKSNADLILTNGKFADARGVVGSALTIKNGRIVNIGQTPPPASGVRTIDLGGRTVIPGFFDAHVHYTRAAMNPGHERAHRARRFDR